MQVKREGDVCLVKCRITPEHRVRSKPYQCTLKCNEKDGEVLCVECEDCAASKGGCKHAIAFLMWLHRRSEEPATTAVKCYWKKSTLSGKAFGELRGLKELRKSEGSLGNSESPESYGFNRVSISQAFLCQLTVLTKE